MLLMTPGTDSGTEVKAPLGTSRRVRLRVALAIGATVWLLLLSAGFRAPGGWSWGMPGPVGHIENYVISLWFVSLVLAPLLAARDPEGQAGALRLFLLAILAILVSTIRREPLKL